MNRIETEKYIDSLTSDEKDQLVKRMTDELKKYQKFIDIHRNYLENLPTKELRIKEINRLRKEHNDRRK